MNRDTLPTTYDAFPTHPLEPGRIRTGYPVIAEVIATAIVSGARRVAIEGYVGVLWLQLRTALADALYQTGVEPEWRHSEEWLLPPDELLARIEPSLGVGDPLFGRLYEGDLADFFEPNPRVDPSSDRPLIVCGPGAALLGPHDLLLYVDVPKDEIQRRGREGTIGNLGAAAPESRGEMYKRFFFVDWPVLNRQKARLLPSIDWYVDAGDQTAPAMMAGVDLRRALDDLAANWFRVRPWFAPGPWGGQFLKHAVRGLDQDVPNYAWSYELITPENGLVFESSGSRLECSFDLLMYRRNRDVLGHAADRFGYHFPIRFDYLDTMGGGNLSIQCHPRPEYIRREFGEPFTQDESYYIVTNRPGARVYLGFRDNVQPDEFRAAAEGSHRGQVPMDVDRYVNSVPSHPHDLFLIPNGTIHGSGTDNLVLEISATPYIYTFKIYDWVRRDLSGNLRPLNIERAWQNLYFERQEAYVREYLTPRPQVIGSGEGWRELFLGTHPALFYQVHRYEFTQPVTAVTENRFHVLNLVEGESVWLETANGSRAEFHFGETFVVPAAAGSYRLSPGEGKACKVVKVFVKC